MYARRSTCQDVMLIRREFPAIFTSEISNVSHSEGVKSLEMCLCKLAGPLTALPCELQAREYINILSKI